MGAQHLQIEWTQHYLIADKIFQRIRTDTKEILLMRIKMQQMSLQWVKMENKI
jgi:hypothetical protein